MNARLVLPLGLSAAIAAGSSAAQTAAADDEARAVHERVLTIDSHIDIGPGYGTPQLDPATETWAQVDLPSMRAGGLDAGFFIVFTPQGDLSAEGYARAAEAAEEKYRGIRRMLDANPDDIALATSADEVEAIHAAGKLVALIGVENSFPLGTTAEEVLQTVAIWAARGARYASITHFGHNQFGGSSNPNLARRDGADPGLSDLGKVLVGALNDHGIMVDVSHVGPRTAAEAMEASRAPVIASHSTVAGVYDNPRGLTDGQLAAIRDDGGVAQITAYRSYLGPIDPRIKAARGELRQRLGLTSYAAFVAASTETLTEFRNESRRIRQEFDDVGLARLLDHLDHAVKIAGIDHVGLSGDFDGGGGVEDWDGAAESPNVTAALLARGYSEQEIAKIWGGNLLRVMRDVEAAAK